VADTITVSGSSASNVTINLNGTPTVHNIARGLRMRAHGGDDAVSLAGITFSSANIKPFVAGGPGADALTGGNLPDTFLGGAGNDAIHGGNAANTASYLDSPAGVVVDLPTDTTSDGYGDTDTYIKIGNAIGSAFGDTLTGDEGNNILGGSGGDDTITGNDGNDRLQGGAGNDILDGSLGQDTAGYGDSPVGVNADIPGGTASDGYGTTDTLISIERLGGSRFNDTLTGDSNPNIINGENGHDVIVGGAGADLLQGQRGSDTLYANTAACTDDGAIDTLNGGPNNDTGYYTFAQDLPTAIEIANDCP
jgi:Ca2+-binding RTX toxin-like protein